MNSFSNISIFLNKLARKTDDLAWVIFFFLVVLAIENVLVLLWAYNIHGVAMATVGRTYTVSGVYSIAMLCSGAASFVGGLIGFLFGIPKSDPVENAVRVVDAAHIGGLPTGAADPDRQPRRGEIAATLGVAAEHQMARNSGLHRNTNLESISDGLTKGLLAIGISQLYNLGDWSSQIGAALGASFGPGNDGRIAAVVVLIYGAIAGLLFGYLATRIYLTGVFARNDPV